MMVWCLIQIKFGQQNRRNNNQLQSLVFWSRFRVLLRWNILSWENTQRMNLCLQIYLYVQSDLLSSDSHEAQAEEPPGSSCRHIYLLIILINSRY